MIADTRFVDTFQFRFPKTMRRIILASPTCEPACTHDNTCSGTICKCGTGTACTGDQTCKVGTCGMYLYPRNIFNVYTNSK